MDKLTLILGGVLSTTRKLEALAFLPERSVVFNRTSYSPSSLKLSSALCKVESDTFSAFHGTFLGRTGFAPARVNVFGALVMLLGLTGIPKVLELATAPLLVPSTRSGRNL